MVAFAAAPDPAAFILDISRLAHHTQNILGDPQVSLLIVEPQQGVSDPQTLARISILGTAEPVLPSGDEHDAAHQAYVSMFPHSAPRFQLGDFGLYRIVPDKARFVAGFGRAYNLLPGRRLGPRGGEMMASRSRAKS